MWQKCDPLRSAVVGLPRGILSGGNNPGPPKTRVLTELIAGGSVRERGVVTKYCCLSVHAPRNTPAGGGGGKRGGGEEEVER